MRHLRFLDVIDIPVSLGPPTTTSGALRKNEKHYLDLDATGNVVTIHSDPVDVPVLDAERAVGRMLETSREPSTSPDADAIGMQDLVDQAREFIGSRRNRVAAFIPFSET